MMHKGPSIKEVCIRGGGGGGGGLVKSGHMRKLGEDGQWQKVDILKFKLLPNFEF